MSWKVVDLGVRSTGARSDVGFKIRVWEDDRIADLRRCRWVSWKVVRSCTGESCKVQRSRSEILQNIHGAYSLRRFTSSRVCYAARAPICRDVMHIYPAQVYNPSNLSTSSSLPEIGRTRYKHSQYRITSANQPHLAVKRVTYLPGLLFCDLITSFQSVQRY